MKMLIVDTFYEAFLEAFYTANPEMRHLSYQNQLERLLEMGFGYIGFYSSNLKSMGHDASGAVPNCQELQNTWMRENHLPIPPREHWQFVLRKGCVPWIVRKRNARWLETILRHQISHLKPDVLLVQMMDVLDPEFVRSIKHLVGMTVGQHASPPFPDSLTKANWNAYDLVVSSFPPTVDFFRSRGVSAALLRLAFEPELLKRIAVRERDVPVSFVGSFFDMHASRTQLLEYLSSRVPLAIWGNASPAGFEDSVLASRYQGPAYGLDMIGVLSRSRIVLNHHGNIAPFANNLRLFEATGSGALLITDWKENLHEMFEPGVEVVTYKSPEECAEQIQFYLGHEEERRRIATAGQQRTLRDHTFLQRMQKLIGIIEQFRHERADLQAPVVQ